MGTPPPHAEMAVDDRIESDGCSETATTAAAAAPPPTTTTTATSRTAAAADDGARVNIGWFRHLEWIMLLPIGGLELLFYVLHPFYRFVGKDMMGDLKYPLKPTTVPFWAVPIIAVLFPCAVSFAVYLRRRDARDLYRAVLGTLYATFVTGMITDALKDLVGRPRPDFFWRCFPDGREVYEDVTTRAICHGKKNMVDDGRKSFPSGHASWSFAGLGFFSWYIAGKMHAFDGRRWGRGQAAVLCLLLLPLLVASLVSITLVNDYMHHWGDVFGGALLGMVVGSLSYLHFFPQPPYHDAHGWRPCAYARVVVEPRNNAVVLPAAAEAGQTPDKGRRRHGESGSSSSSGMTAGRREELPQAV